MSLSPALTGAIAGAAAGAIATAATNAFIHGAAQWVRNRYRRLVDRLRDDHSAIAPGAWPYRCPPEPGTPDVWVQVICAPSRTLHRPKFNVGRAITFVQDHYPGHFPVTAEISTVRDGLQFNKSYQDGIHNNGLARVCTNGRLDLTLPVQVHSDAERNTSSLDILDLLGPIRLVAAASASPDYDEIFHTRRVRRGRRFDWSIAVSITVTCTDGTRQAWEQLRFPGRTPARAGQQRAFCPIGGFAAGQLNSRRATRPVEELLRTFLTSFLAENGYHETEAAIDDVLSAPESRLT